MERSQMSFKISLSPKDRIAGRFLAQLHAVFSNAAVDAKRKRRLTQKQIANELGVDKSVVSRIFKGGGNPTARTIGELAAVMGYRPELVLHKIKVKTEGSTLSNFPEMPEGISKFVPPGIPVAPETGQEISASPSSRNTSVVAA
jgi:transcriptional regulator with XRE-family HTH domain